MNSKSNSGVAPHNHPTSLVIAVLLFGVLTALTVICANHGKAINVIMDTLIKYESEPHQKYKFEIVCDDGVSVSYIATAKIPTSIVCGEIEPEDLASAIEKGVLGAVE